MSANRWEVDDGESDDDEDDTSFFPGNSHKISHQSPLPVTSSSSSNIRYSDTKRYNDAGSSSGGAPRSTSSHTPRLLLYLPRGDSMSHECADVLQMILNSHTDYRLEESEVYDSSPDIESNNSSSDDSVSFFFSILSTIDDRSKKEGNKEVSYDEISPKSSLHLKPSDVPPECDSNDMTIAALLFLSSSLPELDSHPDVFPSLPLLECTDAENFIFRKITTHDDDDWSITTDDSLRRKVANLEKAFLTGTYDKFLGRLRLCPKLGKDAETVLMKTGAVGGAKTKKDGGSKAKQNQAATGKRKHSESGH